MTQDNSIIAEIRKTREELLAEYGGDLAALVKHLQQRTEEAARAGRRVISLPPQPFDSPPTPTKKVG